MVIVQECVICKGLTKCFLYIMVNHKCKVKKEWALKQNREEFQTLGLTEVF